VGEFIDAVRKTMRAQRTGTTELAASTARQHEAMQGFSHQAKILVGELGRALSSDLVRRVSWTLLGPPRIHKPGLASDRARWTPNTRHRT